MDYFRSFGRNFTEYTQEKKTYDLRDKSLSGYEVNELYRNDGGKFTRIGYVSGAGSKRDGRGFVGADFDRDGDLDFFIVNNDQQWLYLENKVGQEKSWSVVQLQGKKNRFGVGARVRITAGGKTQIREIHVGSGFLSSPPPEAHFGLGAAQKIDKLEVRWPWTKEWQTFENLDARRIIVVDEGGGFAYRTLTRSPKPAGADKK